MKKFAELIEEITEEEFETYEFTEEEWDKLSEEDRAEFEECSEGGAVWHEEDLDENAKRYQAQNTNKRRLTQRKKDLNKFKDRSDKRAAKIDCKKAGNRVKRIKLRKKWTKKNKVKIRNANKVFGGKVKSKFTKA